MKRAIAVFDIGKTNKKFLLFDQSLSLISQDEQSIPPITDEDGDECDDIDRIESWIKEKVAEEVQKGDYEISGLNFATYGASLAFLDKKGKRLTPVYNYLKSIPSEISEKWYAENGGKDEFCRKTASPALGVMLNSGVQILWLKNEKPEVFDMVKEILHFPQYLSYLFTGNVLSEHTSIGCHTGMWDFDNMTYHPWLKKEGVTLPEPVSNDHVEAVSIGGKSVKVGTGIHDSSSSLAPYMIGSKEKFLLVSTGTWCISMNPYNYSPLTATELEQDCLCYLSIDEKPVKSSRLFMGHIHDVNTQNLVKHFSVEKDAYKKVKADKKLIKSYLDSEEFANAFFKGGVPDNFTDDSVDLSKFASFEEAYQRLVFDLTKLNVQSIELVSDQDDDVTNIYISGGFARNEIYVRLLANFFPKKSVFTSEIDNATALGAAMVISHVFNKNEKPSVNLNLKEWKGF